MRCFEMRDQSGDDSTGSYGTLAGALQGPAGLRLSVNVVWGWYTSSLEHQVKTPEGWGQQGQGTRASSCSLTEQPRKVPGYGHSSHALKELVRAGQLGLPLNTIVVRRLQGPLCGSGEASDAGFRSGFLMEPSRDQPQAADLLCLRGEGWAEIGTWTSWMEPALRGGRVGEGRR